MLAGLFRGTAPEVRDAALSDPRWWGGASTATWAGVSVSDESALQLLAVYGSATFITDEISTLPLDEKEHPPVWAEHPSDGLDRIAWTGQLVWSLVLAGNCYLAVHKNSAGRVVALDPLDPQSVTVRREGGRKVYYVNGQILYVDGGLLAVL